MAFRIRNILAKKENLAVLFIFLVGIVVRLFHFPEFVTFLGDQGRDAIVIKRIVTLEHFPAIGPPSSLGQIFLGPFYYYLVAPFLLLFQFNPVGLAYGVAFFSLLGIFLSFLIIKKEVSLKSAIVFLIFLTFSRIQIEQSRFSWNPNLLPLFSFLTLYFFYKFLASKNIIYPVLLGSFLAFSLQLHHLAFFLVIPILIYFLIVYKREKRRLLLLKRTGIAFLFFTIFSLPLIIFDLRHQFLNTKSFIRFFTEGNPTDHEQFAIRFFETNQYFFNHIFQISISQYISLALTFFIVVFLINKYFSHKYLFINIHLVNFISFLIIFSFFNAARNFHYYGSIYLSFFLISAFILEHISKRKVIVFLILVFTFGFYIISNTRNLTYIFEPGGDQIKKAETIAQSIIDKKPKQPLQTVALPFVQTDGHIRYFLEIKGYRPLAEDTLEEPLELYVLCFEKECSVLGNPQWQIASFKNSKIEREWSVEDVKIYKLIHEI